MAADSLPDNDTFRALFEHAPDAIYIEDRDGTILEANPAACELQALPHHALVGRNVLDLVPPGERERVRRDFEGWFNGTVTRYEGYADRKGRDPVPVEITGSPLIYRGKPAVLLHVRDVSDRRAAEQALIDREWQMSYALDQGDAIVFRRSFVEDRYDYLAPGIERLTGYTAEEMTPSRWDLLVQHCDFAGELAGLPQGEPRNRFLAGSINRWQSQVQIRRKQGDLRWVHDLSTLVRDAAGRPVGALGVLLDITDFRRAVEELKTSEERLHLVTSQLPAVLWMLDAGLRVTLCEGSALKALQLRPVDVLGRTVQEILGEGENLRIVLPCLRRALEGESTSFELVFSERHLLAHAQPLRGPIRGVVGIAQDVTDLRRMEQHAHSNQRLESLGLMAGGIAHDFNNLLVGILGNADLALQELPPGSPAAGFVEDVKKAGLRASELTNLMLAFSGRSRFVVGPVNLHTLVEEAVHLVRAAVSKRIDFLRNLPPDLPLIEGDGAQLRQVVLNLLINGAEAIGEDAGTITVQAGVGPVDAAMRQDLVGTAALTDAPYAFVRVHDTGCGMDERTLAHVFEPFFSTKFHGRGLGLASCLGIVRSHRGGISVQSERGAGSTFTVYLPLPARPLEAAPVPQPVRAALQGSGTILVADDEPSVRDVAGRMLERLGFRVVIAADGEEALRYCQTHNAPIAAVLLDLTMPRMGGEQALREIRRLRPAVPAVLMSGYDESEALSRYADLGVQAFLQKPFDFGSLTARVQAALTAPPPS